ncbi:MAG: formate dehydrogenase accessory sulfurtransferase FdhD [Proteobacteria bacterium]|nr:formate dehydrogenase accessory sulfurtransferase FdhD [Pseudomonadota bacterium]MBU4278498.1 formate dehydrogenase accessory sulfurtransferase FdhD [Pseudomonadota bacterium]MBU4382134.1 formate dehydrogenase accessory sulfurtransferase FdhD [Pseudomonadota bacterium]MCG2763010.1 formate dehydrogenase accessory sulfurtransferase FdhD [Desulfarculaceae bacterium]
MSAGKNSTSRPRLSRAGLPPVHHIEVVDHLGKRREVAIPGESPLTIKVDGREVVTLMTLGTNPEELALGYLHNQRLLENIADIESVQVDWGRETVKVATRHGEGIPDLEEKLHRVTVTSGCGQGTLFSCTVDKLYEHKLPLVTVRQSTIYKIIEAAAPLNPIYRQAGSIHGCYLCRDGEVIMAVEDVGRHNAADAIAGRMWLEGMPGEDKIMFTTGRLTSEIVMKTAFMGIPVLISKSGVTQMSLELARDMGMVVIGRAKVTRFLIYNGADQVIFDAIPQGEQSKQ